MVRPGGILIIDHRNYDYILETGRAPQGKNIYYKVLQVKHIQNTQPTGSAGVLVFHFHFNVTHRQSYPCCRAISLRTSLPQCCGSTVNLTWSPWTTPSTCQRLPSTTFLRSGRSAGTAVTAGGPHSTLLFQIWNQSPPVVNRVSSVWKLFTRLETCATACERPLRCSCDFLSAEVTELSHACVRHNKKQPQSLFGGVCDAFMLCLAFSVNSVSPTTLIVWRASRSWWLRPFMANWSTRSTETSKPTPQARRRRRATSSTSAGRRHESRKRPLLCVSQKNPTITRSKTS